MFFKIVVFVTWQAAVTEGWPWRYDGGEEGHRQGWQGWRVRLCWGVAGESVARILIKIYATLFDPLTRRSRRQGVEGCGRDKKGRKKGCGREGCGRTWPRARVCVLMWRRTGDRCRRLPAVGGGPRRAYDRPAGRPPLYHSAPAHSGSRRGGVRAARAPGPYVYTNAAGAQSRRARARSVERTQVSHRARYSRAERYQTRDGPTTDASFVRLLHTTPNVLRCAEFSKPYSMAIWHNNFSFFTYYFFFFFLTKFRTNAIFFVFRLSNVRIKRYIFYFFVIDFSHYREYFANYYFLFLFFLFFRRRRLYFLRFYFFFFRFFHRPVYGNRFILFYFFCVRFFDGFSFSTFLLYFVFFFFNRIVSYRFILFFTSLSRPSPKKNHFANAFLPARQRLLRVPNANADETTSVGDDLSTGSVSNHI